MSSNGFLIDEEKVFGPEYTWSVVGVSIVPHEETPTVRRMCRNDDGVYWWKEVDGPEREAVLLAYFRGYLAQGFDPIGSLYETL